MFLVMHRCFSLIIIMLFAYIGAAAYKKCPSFQADAVFLFEPVYNCSVLEMLLGIQQKHLTCCCYYANKLL